MRLRGRVSKLERIHRVRHQSDMPSVICFCAMERTSVGKLKSEPSSAIVLGDLKLEWLTRRANESSRTFLERLGLTKKTIINVPQT